MTISQFEDVVEKAMDKMKYDWQKNVGKDEFPPDLRCAEWVEQFLFYIERKNYYEKKMD